MSTTGRRDSMTADDGTGKYIMSRRGPGRGDGTDLARPKSIVQLLLVYKCDTPVVWVYKELCGLMLPFYIVHCCSSTLEFVVV